MKDENSAIQEIYDKHAKSYDRRTSMMEKMFHKVNYLFSLIHGNILEVGVGTGSNLKNYNPSDRITALDWSPQMISLAKLKSKKNKLENINTFIVGDVQKLTEYFKHNSFDFVVSRCVFCSVPDPLKGLLEVSKVLKPSGKLIQIEHGISKILPLNLFMKLADPITTKAEGFHIKRNHIKNLKKMNFKVIRQWSIDPAGIFKVIVSQYRNGTTEYINS